MHLKLSKGSCPRTLAVDNHLRFVLLNLHGHFVRSRPFYGLVFVVPKKTYCILIHAIYGHLTLQGSHMSMLSIARTPQSLARLLQQILKQPGMQVACQQPIKRHHAMAACQHAARTMHNTPTHADQPGCFEIIHQSKSAAKGARTSQAACSIPAGHCS